ncbi:flagellar basal body P-ring protein FlgI [Aliifodinibius sp. S!AR15-10]|uniref:flagellar basal body P-ring protein FlgI n=1 Tax=Aliifodinibius sp. S!AR15-10 TaxID=2950437 RepID=UPI002866C6A6|nr:flagellar basal body P-ring protein FlgI [Aliifodinibius sp. S!AR15-10]MDR8394230.1 flagellar basal body P-ring protein FlgI [Aliifodinibius sp. S!AR15-10]
MKYTNWNIFRGVGLLLTVLIMISLVAGETRAQTRLSDLVKVQHAQPKKLIGYGLVTGLDRSGDRTISSRGAAFTVRSIANMLQKFGITVDSDRLRTRNVAAVMVTATIGPYHAPGSEISVTVSSVGDASSLEGGVLLQTPLLEPDTEQVYAKAQGPLVVGGINAEIPGSRIRRNQTLTATIPSGGVVEQNQKFTPDTDAPLGLVLREPSYTNARRISEAINNNFDEQLASVFNPGLIQVDWPDVFQAQGMRNTFISTILEQQIQVDTPARVVINERTGTIVTGGSVTIDDALISHGSIQVRTQVTPYVSQPPPLSGGETQVLPVPEVGISEESAQNIVLQPNTNVQQLAGSLDNLGLSPRDIISIFQALERAGALRGELIVM